MLDETCPYTGTEVCMNPQGKLQSKIVDKISKLRHPVVKVSIADNDSKIRQRQCKPTNAVKVDKGTKSRQRQYKSTKSVTVD